MKRTFCLLAMMAFFAISLSGQAKTVKSQPKKIVRQLQMEFIQDFIEEAAAHEKLEPALIRAIIRVESNFNYKAVSPVGAKGLMQLMPVTARELGHKKALDPKNPRANIYAGAKYIRELINMFDGNLKLAIAAYNAGPNAVLKHHGIPPYAETQLYVKRVLAQVPIERRELLKTQID